MTRTRRKGGKKVTPVKIVKSDDESESEEVDDEELESDVEDEASAKKKGKKVAKSAIEKKLDILIASHTKLLKLNEATNSKINEFQRAMKIMQKEMEKKDCIIQELRDELNEFQQHYRSNFIEIHNLTEPINESQKDLETSILKVIETVGVPIQSNDVDIFHRIPTRRANAAKPVLIQLISRKKRNEILDAQKKNFKDKKKVTQHDIFNDGSDATIYVNESLTRFNKELLYEAKKTKGKHDFHAAYNVGGKIFIKKTEEGRPIRIKNFSDLMAFEANDDARED